MGKRQVNELKGEIAGKSFVHYILMELIAFRSLKEKRFDIQYWRTKTGLIEILPWQNFLEKLWNDEIAI